MVVLLMQQHWLALTVYLRTVCEQTVRLDLDESAQTSVYLLKARDAASHQAQDSRACVLCDLLSLLSLTGSSCPIFQRVIMQQCVPGQARLTCGLRRSRSSSSGKFQRVSGNPLLLCHVNLRLPSVPFGRSSRSRGLSQARHHLDSRRNRVIVHGLGKDTVEGWIDLSKLVSGSGGIKTAYDDLAYKIGEILWRFQLGYLDKCRISAHSLKIFGFDQVMMCTLM